MSTGQSDRVIENGTKSLKTGQVVQYYLCYDCGRRFNERTGTSISRLRTPVSVVEMALKVRGEGLGVRATGRVLDKSPSCITAWEERLSTQLSSWSPPAPKDGDATVEGDEVYTRVDKNLPPEESEGWIISFIERESRYWVEAKAGLKTQSLLKQGVNLRFAFGYLLKVG